MVESKTRKAAFLREAARFLKLNATVENARFEAVAAEGAYAGQMDVVSIRALKIDAPILSTAKAFLNAGGTIALFSPTPASPPDLPGHLRVTGLAPLVGTSHLVLLGR